MLHLYYLYLRSMMHFFQINISPVLFLVVRWQRFSNCLSDYVCIEYLFHTSCDLLHMSMGYLKPLVQNKMATLKHFLKLSNLHLGYKLIEIIFGLSSVFKVAYYSFIRGQEVYTINMCKFIIFLHQYSDNK